ncbi:MAG: hypothetical protein MJ166_03755 [Clostridia bacterium]|nr:hypothetical protein [Clostridia bacterium]
MAILHKLFEQSSSDDLINSVGNLIVSGVENKGSYIIYKDMVAHALSTKKTIILANGAIIDSERETMEAFVKSSLSDRTLFSFGYGDYSDSVDILTAFSNPIEKAEFIIKAASLISGLSEAIKSVGKRFYCYAIEAFDSLGMSYKFNDLLDLNIELVKSKVSLTALSDLEKENRFMFLNDATTYASIAALSTALFPLKFDGLSRMFSGSTSLNSVLGEGNMIMLNATPTEEANKKKTFLDLTLNSIAKFLEKNKTSSKVLFINRKADFVDVEVVRSILEFNSTLKYSMYFFIEDISKYISINGNDILDSTKSYLVFTQNSDANCNFWSQFFGSREMKDISHSYTAKKGLLSSMIPSVGGGVVASPKNYKTTTQTIQKVVKPIYQPSVFLELKNTDVMVFSRAPLKRRKAKIEV